MTLALCYWVVMLLWLILGITSHVPKIGDGKWGWVPNAILFVLLLLLGWAVFGAPLRT